MFLWYCSSWLRRTISGCRAKRKKGLREVPAPLEGDSVDRLLTFHLHRCRPGDTESHHDERDLKLPNAWQHRQQIVSLSAVVKEVEDVGVLDL